jgi:hydrogenase-4 component B
VVLLRSKAADAGVPPAGLALPAAALAAAALLLPWWLLPEATGLARDYPLGRAAVLDGVWPIALAAALGLALLGLRPRYPAIPEGDLAVPLERMSVAVVAWAGRLPAPRARTFGLDAAGLLARAARPAEALLGRWPVAGILAALLAVALAAAAALGS